MGQQQSQQPGSTPKTKPSPIPNLDKNTKINGEWPKQTIKHQNILRVSKTPFESCEKIQINNQVYFIEKTRNNLKEIIMAKQRLKKSFSQTQVMKLIQNMVYTLAYLQNIDIAYPLLTPQNIFSCQNSYKLLPPSYVPQSLYQKLTQSKQPQNQPSSPSSPSSPSPALSFQYLPASPQMLIALRCREPQINQKQILYKSNVFALGLLMLQVCTTKESKECYDFQNLEILDGVVNQRLGEIQEKYSNRVVRIVANMLDYDFQERMDPKELAIWVNRQTADTDHQPHAHAHSTPHQHPHSHSHLHSNPHSHPRPSPTLKQTPSFPKNQLKLQNTQMIKSRLIQQPNVHKSRIKLQIPVTQYKVENATSKRIVQIRSKIIKEKIKAQQEFVEENNLGKSRRALSYTKLGQNRQRDRDKNLPNPYMNPSHIAPSQQNTRLNLSPSPYNNHRPKVLNSRYLYTQAYQQDPLMASDQELDRNLSPPNYQNMGRANTGNSNISANGNVSRVKDFNLKYKYNFQEEDRESARLSSNRKRDSQRFVRVQKYLAQYQRAGSKKESDFIDKSPSKRTYTQHSASISDFSFQPQRQFVQKQLLRKYDQQPQQQPNTLKKSTNQLRQPKFQQVLQDYNRIEQQPQQQKKQMKIIISGPSSSHPYQRHQQLFNDDRKSTAKQVKNVQRGQKENQDIKMIKKEIQRSRRIIEEVRKTQSQAVE